ncbi:MAG TPA: hypothetical protein VHM89_02400 [Acidimicrobiales bacterium]|nr:hypothetical protein [Acidimicrobiales bacterium]
MPPTKISLPLSTVRVISMRPSGRDALNAMPTPMWASLSSWAPGITVMQSSA